MNFFVVIQHKVVMPKFNSSVNPFGYHVLPELFNKMRVEGDSEHFFIVELLHFIDELLDKPHFLHFLASEYLELFLALLIRDFQMSIDKVFRMLFCYFRVETPHELMDVFDYVVDVLLRVLFFHKKLLQLKQVNHRTLRIRLKGLH